MNFNSSDLFLISGANSGLGKAITYKIIELGASVVSIARNQEKSEAAKIAATNPEKFNIELRDLSENTDSLALWINELAAKYGKFRGFVHCAGIQETLPLQAVNFEKMKKLFDINFFAGLALAKGISKKQNNIGAGTSLVFISSFVSRIGLPGIVGYTASKGALNAAVRTLAVELARNGIRVNAILPGHIETELLSEDKNLNEKFIETLRQKYPLGLGKPDDVANAACFLLSDDARWISGTELVVDGAGSLIF
jgi:NAD(P)-dependent dehydrogenase (short-subunit alcohol dehydrogenase family)